MKPELSQVWTFQFFLLFLFEQPFQGPQVPLASLAASPRPSRKDPPNIFVSDIFAHTELLAAPGALIAPVTGRRRPVDIPAFSGSIQAVSRYPHRWLIPLMAESTFHLATPA